jgi:hypothetical protein
MIEFPTDRQLDEMAKKQLLDELFDTVPEGTMRYNNNTMEVYAGKKWIKMR